MLIMAEPKAVAPPPLRPAARDPGTEPLTPWERLGLVAFFALALGFGGLVEMRSAFLSRRMGDLDCFLRAAWAVRAGADLYDVTDDNGFHYNYPPLLAILAAPLADPPAGAGHAGMLPWPVSVGIWYVLNLVCLALAAHWLAGALDRHRDGAGGVSPRSAPGSRRWWALRLWPVLACVVPIGHTLMRGQSNLLVLALLGGMVAALLRGRRFAAGLCLAGTVCLKIFPAFLLLFPLWRRDGRGLAGCAAGLFLGLVVIPAAALGPARAGYCYRRLTAVLIAPGLGAGTDDSRATELTNVTATDSQSILAVLHNSLHPQFATRPPKAAAGVRLASYLLGGLLTLLTLAAAGWRCADDPPSVVLFLGVLVLDMLLLCPVCHLHYFSLALPLVMALLVVRWERQGTLGLGAGLTGLLVVNALANLLPHFPRLIVLREQGLALYAALALWFVGVVVLWRRGRTRRRPALPLPGRPEAAAA
jgi:hypothetical protein